MIEQDDSILIQQCLEGNRKAYEAIVDKYQRPLYNVAYRFLQNAEDAEDVTQSVFIKAFEKLHSYKSNFKFFSWIYRIAVNESINYKDARRPSAEIDEHLASNERSPERIFLAGEIEQQIRKALIQLKTEYQIVIILKHFQDCTYEEMSDILEIPAKTVKSRLFSARQLLKEILIKQKSDD